MRFSSPKMTGYGYDSAKFLGVGATEANIIPYGITSPKIKASQNLNPASPGSQVFKVVLLF